LSKSWKSRLKESLSETGGRDIRVVEVISGVAIFLAIVGFFVDYFGRFFAPKDSLILLTPAFIFSGIYFKIGQTGYEQDFTILELEEVEKKAESIDNNSSIPSPSKIRQELEILMKEKKIYLTPDIRITTLCEELRTNRTYLSQVLNDELKENFNSYINKYRVKYAIELLKDKKWDKYSLDKFAELSGFGSTISMIRAFKQLTGKTPREFRV
jgi:AraC-like DNA-binding protein